MLKPSFIELEKSNTQNPDFTLTKNLSVFKKDFYAI